MIFKMCEVYLIPNFPINLNLPLYSIGDYI